MLLCTVVLQCLYTPSPAQIENPIAIVDRNVDKREPAVRAAAEAFVKYLYTPAAQREFSACGFRSVDKSVAAESTLPKVWPSRAWPGRCLRGC